MTTESAMPSVAATTTGAIDEGIMWRVTIRRWPAPSALPACTKSASRSERNSPRTSRAAVVQPVNPMAMMITQALPVPQKATSIRIRKKVGIDRTMSTMRIRALSAHPPK